MFFICYTGYAMDFGSETGNTTAQRLELSSRRTTITPLNENITLEQFDGEAAVSRHLVEPAIANISIDTEATRHDPHHTHGYNPPRYQPHYGLLIVIIGVLLLLIAGIAGLTNILSRLR